MQRLLRHARCMLAAALFLSVSAAGCGNKTDSPEAAPISADSAITEKNDTAEVTWSISPDGQVVARVRNKDDLPITDGVSGTLTVKPASGGQPVAVPLTMKDGYLTGQMPKLDADLTEVGYDLDVEGAKIKGVMHLPRGGTQELVESAKEAAAAKKIAPDAKGPNGGVVQVVGDDIVEVVADKDSGAVRMYMLDDDLKPIPVGKRKGKLAFGGAAPEIVELNPDPGGMFLAGKCVGKVQPVKITIEVIDGDEIDVAIYHYVPGGIIVVGPAAPVVAVFIVTGWTVVVVPTPVIVQPGVIVVHKGKGKGKFKIKHKHW
jgi:hypothetical protein